MRATGIVRRIDNLGRIVIPKEIRRTMHICEGDSLEIFVEATGEIIFKKYSTLGELGSFAKQYAEILSQVAAAPVIISDREKVVASSSNVQNSVIGKVVSKDFDQIIQSRKTYIAKSDRVLYPIQGVDLKVLVCVPIISSGDLIGSILIADDNSGVVMSDTQVKLAQMIALIFDKQIAN